MPTAIDIYKLLPKTNCKDCALPTCLAFAMQLANSKIKIEACPHLSREARLALEEAFLPPIALIKIGEGRESVEVGGETEIFRHNKAFFHPTAYAVMIKCDEEPKRIEARIKEAENFRFERIGEWLKIDLIALQCGRRDATHFAKFAKNVASKTFLPLIVMASEPKIAKAALEEIGSRKPLVVGTSPSNLEAMVNLAMNYKVPLAIGGESLNTLVDSVSKARDMGLKDIILDISNKTPLHTVQEATALRRLAIKKKFRPSGYPLLLDLSRDDYAFYKGILGTLKYVSIIIFKDVEPSMMYPLFVLRQNIYTDPRSPLQVTPEIYKIGDADENSPLLFTANFSLSYFTVRGDVEKSKIPCWLLVVDTEGLSVLTAFSAGKLTAEKVAMALEKFEARKKIKHNKLIIPGMLAKMKPKLEELSGMKVIIGPRESSGLPKFLKDFIKEPTT